MEKEYSYFTAKEFVGSLSELSDFDMKQLILFSERLCHRYDLGCDGEDIFQESVERIIAGDRNIPKELPIVVGIYGVISSVADSFLKSKSELFRKQSYNLDDDSNPLIERAKAQMTSAPKDDESLSEQKWKIIVDFFEGDDDVLQLLDMLANGIKAAVIVKKLFNGDKKKYDTTYKRFMRKRNKLQLEATSL